MTGEFPDAATLSAQVLATPRAGRRRLVALAGPPASGKSTLAQNLADLLDAGGCPAQVVPMDGFHLDNRILENRGMLARKGAPETFDMQGFLHLVTRLHDETEVFHPVFDRTRDIAVAGAGRIGSDCDTVVIEGNYLLFDAPGWRDLAGHWDLSIRLNLPDEVLRARLIDRWVTHGLSPSQAAERAARNDLPNAARVNAAKLPANIEI
ncbi:MAG: nucleoside/nucleotide kinase family protein [Rhodobacteraceae bacterium]|nr:nucleoside/nucleotide kinase family protein [Paracoccaceae bacterium]